MHPVSEPAGTPLYNLPADADFVSSTPVAVNKVPNLDYRAVERGELGMKAAPDGLIDRFSARFDEFMMIASHGNCTNIDDGSRLFFGRNSARDQ